MAVEDIAIAAHAGVARPFVTRHADELSRLVKSGRKAVEFCPERVRDLKVVALVPDDINEGAVTRIAEIILG